MTTKNGRFVWYELMTTDPQAAKVFYGEVIGWKTRPFGSAGDYEMWVGAQGPLGGVTVLPEEAKKMGAPPHWMANVTVADLDAALVKVKESGGQVYAGPMAVPTVGRFAVVADPQGATISAFQPEGDMKPHDGSKHGEFCWSELATTDYKAAAGFYGKVFGWQKVGEFDMGPMGMYFLFGEGEEQRGGMFDKPADMPASAWLHYIQVDDLEAAMGRATRMGAKLLNGPMDIPGNARIAQMMDPQGAAFALHALKPAQ